eukprot:3981469-Pleurochrysis_carterae.AAC.1
MRLAVRPVPTQTLHVGDNLDRVDHVRDGVQGVELQAARREECKLEAARNHPAAHLERKCTGAENRAEPTTETVEASEAKVSREGAEWRKQVESSMRQGIGRNLQVTN